MPRPMFAIGVALVLAGSSLAAGTPPTPPAPAGVESAIAQLRESKPLTPQELAALEATVDAAIATSPENDRVQYCRVLCDRAKGDRKQAKVAIESLVKANPAVAEYHSTYGTLCFEVINDAGTFEKMSLASTGRAEYEKALELDPNLIEPRIGLGRFFLMAPGYAGGSYRKSEEQASALIALPNGKGEIYGRTLLADIYADKGDWEKMNEQYQLAENATGTGANPSNALRGYTFALLNKKKDPKAALVVLDRYQKIAAPDDAGPWYLTGEAKKALGDDAGAIEAYAKAVEIRPDAMNSRFLLAELLEKNKRYAEASTQYSEFVRRFPKDDRAAKAAASAAACDKRSK